MGEIRSIVFRQLMVWILVSAGTSCATSGAPETETPTAAEPLAPREAEPARTDEQVQPDGLPEAQPPEGPPSRLPPRPGETEFDWLLLNSGERLKGELKELRNGTLLFNSDEFDDQELDWDDVAEVWSPFEQTVVLNDRSEVIGFLHVVDGVVIVMREGTEERIDRNRMMAIVPSGDRELDNWRAKLTLGATIRSGNTNQTDLSAKVDLRRRTAISRLFANYLGTLSELEGEQTANNHLADAKFDIFLTPRLFVTPAFVQYFRDPFQNVEGRIVPGAGLGYDLLQSGDYALKVDWDVTVGGAFRYEKAVSIVADEDLETTSGAAVVGTFFEADITDDVEFTFRYALQVGVPKTQDTNMHTEATVSVELTSVLDLDLTFVWDRVGDPKTDADGNVPDNDDFRMIVGIGLDFD